MKRKLFAILLTCAMVVGLAACGGGGAASEASSAASGGESAAEEYTVVYLTPSTESEYWQYNEVGMRNAIVDLEAERGIKINFDVQGPATEAESDAYIKAFETVTSTKPDAILTATLTAEATVPKAKEAQEAGIYVNFVGMGLEGGDTNEYGDYYGVHYYCNNLNVGRTAGKAFLEGLEAKGIEPKGVVGMHMSVVVPTLEDRMRGFKEYLNENAPDIEVIDTLYNENDVQKAQTNVETQISTYGDELIGFFGGNNISGDGISLAVKNAGKGDTILGVAVDSDSVEIEGLENGTLYGIIVQSPYQQGYDAMVNAIDYLQTGKNNAPSKHVDCPSTCVTAENMNSDEMQALLNPKLLIKY